VLVLYLLRKIFAEQKEEEENSMRKLALKEAAPLKGGGASKMRKATKGKIKLVLKGKGTPRARSLKGKTDGIQSCSSRSSLVSNGSINPKLQLRRKTKKTFSLQEHKPGTGAGTDTGTDTDIKKKFSLSMGIHAKKNRIMKKFSIKKKGSFSKQIVPVDSDLRPNVLLAMGRPDKGLPTLTPLTPVTEVTEVTEEQKKRQLGAGGGDSVDQPDKASKKKKKKFHLKKKQDGAAKSSKNAEGTDTGPKKSKGELKTEFDKLSRPEEPPKEYAPASTTLDEANRKVEFTSRWPHAAGHDDQNPE